jgi:hypothetical protein
MARIERTVPLFSETLDLLSVFLAATIQNGWSRPIMRRHTKDTNVHAYPIFNGILSNSEWFEF